MHSVSQTMRLLENVGFNVGDPRRPQCVMALSDIYNDVEVYAFPKRLVRGPKRS